LAFTVTVPCLENVTLVITREFSPVGINQYRRGLFKDIETSCCFSEGLVLEKLLPHSPICLLIALNMLEEVSSLSDKKNQCRFHGFILNLQFYE